jgi:5-(carboxyamino)imidazole ribonucleotide synthase
LKQIPFAGIKVGILGGGQLARMLALKAHELGFVPLVFSASASDPAAQVTPLHIKGEVTHGTTSAKNLNALKSFLKMCDVVTFESEFLNAQLLAELSIESGTAILPKPEKMAELQDRLTQKRLLVKAKLDTAHFTSVDNMDDLNAAFNIIGPKLVLKKRLFGYDGNGTFFVNKSDPVAKLKKIFEQNGSTHISTQGSTQSSAVAGFIAEEFIPFKQELALIVGRDLFKNFISYPLVQSKQTQARCDWIMGPVHHKKEKKFIKNIQSFLDKNNYVGVMGIECFDTGKNLIINEIAPRVHNTGHYTLNVTYPDQFTAHIKAVCGQKLIQPLTACKGFAMANLLGSSDLTAKWETDIRASLHWYGKQDNRPGRKMGHINCIASSPKKALELALKERKKFKL